MIPSRAEIVTALWGAIRLARFDDRGMAVFGDTDTAFWHSFFAAVLIAPMYVLWLLAEPAALPENMSLGLGLAYELAGYAVAWLLFPVIVWHAVGAFGREAHYRRFIVAYNWAAVIQNVIFMIVDIPAATGLLPDQARQFFGLLLMVFVFAYGWFVAKTALGIDGRQAALIVALDILVAVVWEGFTDKLVA